MRPKLKLIVNHYLELVEAAGCGDLARFRGLLANGADANARSEDGSTVLHRAAAWDDLPIAAILVGHGADIHARDWQGSTPLHQAAFYASIDMIGLLLDRGADINVRDNNGWTPLHKAARIGRVEEVAFLVGRGADAGFREHKGRTPLDVALDNDFLHDRWQALGRLLGERNPRAEASPSLASPSQIARESKNGGNCNDQNDRGRGR